MRLFSNRKHLNRKYMVFGQLDCSTGTFATIIGAFRWKREKAFLFFCMFKTEFSHFNLFAPEHTFSRWKHSRNGAFCGFTLFCWSENVGKPNEKLWLNGKMRQKQRLSDYTRIKCRMSGMEEKKSRTASSWKFTHSWYRSIGAKTNSE